MTALLEPDEYSSVTVAQPAADRRLRLLIPPRSEVATILGTPVDVATESELLARVAGAVDAEAPTVFVGLYAALFRTMAHDEVYHCDVSRSVTYPDGRGVVSELQLRGVARAERLATTDVVHPIMASAAVQGWRVGFYGANAEVAERAAAGLRAAHPGLRIVAVWDGYRKLEAEALRAARLDVIFVGIGAGRQERWAHDVAVAAGVPAILTCGGLFDFLAGDKARAPRWMQKMGLEWAFRVLLEPRRLFMRYLLGNGYFMTAARRERRRRAN